MHPTLTMSSASPVIGFALGGLAGNNAHGAGFLHGALTHGLEPTMISCTSGQIYWLYEYLQARGGDPDHLRTTFLQEIEELHRFRNINIDYSNVALRGRPGVFRPAYREFPFDLARNVTGAVTRLLANPSDNFWARELLGSLPGRLLVPEFPPEFFQRISDAFNAEHDIGIAFNSYCPVEGKEIVYLNDAARRQLAPSGGKYQPGYQSSSRQRTSYEAITPEAVKAGLWIYEYGFEDPAARTVDGAYYRQIMLKELTGADVLIVARPINHRWLASSGSDPGENAALPRRYIEIQDLKTEINFNGSYTGERAQIQLINDLVRQRDEAAHKGDGNCAILNKYRHISLVEIEIAIQRSYFDYIFESPAVFDQAAEAIARRLESDEMRALFPAAHGEQPG
jgi:hypothetical protein